MKNDNDKNHIEEIFLNSNYPNLIQKNLKKLER